MEHIIKDKIQQHYSNLTGSQRALSHFIIDHTDEVPFLSSSLLARKVGISDASVTRFCTVLGYSGYADFQRDMQRCLQMRLAPFERMEKSARGEKENIYREVYDLDIQNLKETMDGISLSKLEEVISVLSHSQRIFIIGLRSSFALAYLAHHLLTRILAKAILLDTAQGLLFDPVIDVGPKDVLLAISFPRYAKSTLQLAQYSKNNGCRIIAITDSILSPLAQISDLILPVKISSKSFFSSYTAVVYIINCIITRLSVINHKKSVEALKKIESNLHQSNTWVMKPS